MREVLVLNLAQYQLCHDEWAYLVRERVEWIIQILLVQGRWY